MKRTLIACLTALILFPWTSNAEDEGYFLSLKQKGQLITRGRIQDADGNWYDIMICPGYIQPIDYSKKNLKQAGNNLTEYFTSKPYKSIKKHSSDAYEWAFEDCLQEYVWEGTGKAWKKNFSAAKKRVDRRVFGWWLSYPWAVMQSSVDNVVRIPAGLTGTALGTVWGTAVVPAGTLAAPAVEATWNGGVEGVALPASGLIWNTAASPAMALVGQTPAPERVDGFWVRNVSSGSTYNPKTEDFEALLQWGTLLRDELADYQTQRTVVNATLNTRLDELREEQARAQDAAAQQQQEIADKEEEWVAQLQQSAAPQKLWSRKDVKSNRTAIQEYLEQQTDLTASERNQILRLLSTYPPAPQEQHPGQTAPKTDPASESLKVLGDL
jgi:hypothetical protein